MKRIGSADGDETWDNLILRGEVARDYRFDASAALRQLRGEEHRSS